MKPRMLVDIVLLVLLFALGTLNGYIIASGRCHGRCDKDDALDMHSVARPEQPRSPR